MSTDTAEPPAAAAAEQTLSALHHSHDLLAEAVRPLTDEQIMGPSYASEWSLADLLSHVGSGAEICRLMLQAGLSGSAAPEQHEFQQIWDVWNAKAPRAQVDDGLASDKGLLDAVDAMTTQQRDDFAVDWFMGRSNLADFLKLRLSESAVHSWDARVMFDPRAVVAEDAAALMIDRLALFVGFAAKPGDDTTDVTVQTTAPDRRLALHLSPDGSTLTEAEGGTDSGAVLRLPAEAFVRLFYGRLDPAHTPDGVIAEGLDLDRLRAAFPGF